MDFSHPLYSQSWKGSNGGRTARYVARNASATASLHWVRVSWRLHWRSFLERSRSRSILYTTTSRRGYHLHVVSATHPQPPQGDWTLFSPGPAAFIISNNNYHLDFFCLYFAFIDFHFFINKHLSYLILSYIDTYISHFLRLLLPFFCLCLFLLILHVFCVFTCL